MGTERADAMTTLAELYAQGRITRAERMVIGQAVALEPEPAALKEAALPLARGGLLATGWIIPPVHTLRMHGYERPRIVFFHHVTVGNGVQIDLKNIDALYRLRDDIDAALSHRPSPTPSEAAA